MLMTTPDILSRVDRTPSFDRLRGEMSSAGSTSTSGVVEPAQGGRIGQTFADILNASKAPAQSGSVASTAPAVGQSYADFLNHRRTQMGLDDGQEPKEGEPALGFLNRRMKAAVVKPAVTTGTTTAPATAPAAAAATKGTGARPGETAIDEVNKKKSVDEAAERHTKAEKAAEGLVSNALILPILKQVRRSAFAQNDVFSGGNGEKAFGPEFDMQLSDRIAKSPRLGVKNALVARLEKHHGVATPTPAAKQVKRLDVNG